MNNYIPFRQIYRKTNLLFYKNISERPVIKTLPSSLGIVDYFIVLCQKQASEELFNSNGYDSLGVWSDNVESQIALCVDDEDFNLPIYVLHASATDRAEPISFIPELAENAEYFSKNMTCLDSVMTLHCIAAKRSREYVHLKTGFHHYHASSLSPSEEGPNSWETMHMIYENDYKNIIINYDDFKKSYGQIKPIWLNAINI